MTFFEYLVSNGWHALTLDEVDRAGRGETTLPEKSILITIDDAYASDYTRIYPLLLATRMPAVFAAPAAWIERGQGPDGEAVLTWAQAREMQESGLVEFASHSYDLHGTVRGNPQANLVPAFCGPHFRSRTGLRGRRRVPPSRGGRPAAIDRGDDARAGTRAASHRLALWPLHAERRRDREGSRLSLRSHVRSGAGLGEPSARAREVLAVQRNAAVRAGQAAAGRRHAAAHSAVRTPSALLVVAAGSRRDRAPARRGYRARPDPGRHGRRDRRGRAGTGRRSCGVVPDASDTRPR